MVIYDLAPDYYDTYRDKVRKVSTDDVLRAAQAHLHPDKLQTVVVGDAKTIRESVASLNLGELQIHQP